MSEVQQLVAALSLKDSFSGPLGKIRKNLSGFDAQLGKTEGRAYKAGQQIGTGIKRGAVIAAGAIGLISTQVIAGIKTLAQLETLTLQTNAVIKSTKGVAGQTAESIRNLAEKYEGLNATIDDKVIQSAENVLLTFTAVRKDAFEPAIEAALNMSTALGTDLQGSVIQVGKALQDPIRGITALRRAGVNFSADQVKVIKTLVETGKTAEAQRLILAELNKEFGGSFVAAGKGAEGTLAAIHDAVEDLQVALADALYPTLQKFLPKIRASLADPKTVATISKIGDAIAGLFSDENMKQGGEILRSVFETAKAAAPVVAQAAKATLGLVKAAVSLFTSLPKEVQALAVGAFAINKITGGLVTNLASGLIGNVLKQLVAGVVNVKGATVVVSGGVGGAAAPVGGGAKGALGKVAAAAGKVFLVGAAIGVFSELKGILDEQSGRNKEQAAGLTGQTNAYVKVAGITEMRAALAGIEAEQRRLENTWEAEGFAYRANVDGVRDAVNAQAATLKAAIANAESQSASRQVIATERAQAIASGKADAIRLASERAATAVRQVEAAENRTANATRSVAAQVARARAAQVAATNRTSAIVKSKRFAVSVSNVINTAIRVSSRETSAVQTTYKKAFGFVT